MLQSIFCNSPLLLIFPCIMFALIDNQDDLGSSYTIEGNLSNILFHTHTESGLLITSDAKIVLL